MLMNSRINTNNKYKEYLYKRGYLISDEKISVKPNWKSVEIKINDKKYLYLSSDTLNEIEVIKKGKVWVAILGTVMDTIDYHMNLKKISEKLIQLYLISEEKMLDYVDYLNGRHIILYGDENNYFLIQDATGMRSVFYSINQLLIASHYNIIDDIIQDEEHPFMNSFMYPPTGINVAKPWTLPGNITPLKNIKMLLPNHKLCLNDMSISRFWPRKNHEDISVNRALEYIVDNIYKQMNTLVKYHKLCISLTKGNDSRITLASSKEIKDTVLYFSHTREGHFYEEDMQFAQEISKQYELNYLCVNLDLVDRNSEDFKQLNEVITANHYHEYDRTAAYQYLKDLPTNRIHIRSNLIEIIRSFWLFSGIKDNCDAKELTKIVYPAFAEDVTCINLFAEYLIEQEFNKIFNYHCQDLIYWEYRMGTWLNAGVLLQDDIIFDTYMLFNCRKLLEYGLSMPRYFKLQSTIVNEVVCRLWPQMWEYIPNTQYSLRDYYIYDTTGLIEIGKGTVIAGSILEKGIFESFSRLGRYNAIFGFAKSLVYAGEYVKYDTVLPICDGVGVLQIDILINTTNCLTKNFANYEILLGDEIVYKCGIALFQNKVNQINIIYNFNNKESKKLSIQLIAMMDYFAEYGAAGLINICSIRYSAQPQYIIPAKPLVISTYENLKVFQDKK